MKDNNSRYRLGLDLGSNSIGWALFELGEGDIPKKLEKAGVRIFSNSRAAKTDIPLSVSRRVARGARRRRDRQLQRKRNLINFLRRSGIIEGSSLPRKEFFDLDPYQLRHEALGRKLTNEELVRVLLHLSQRRGFLSNRKNLAKDEGGKSLSGDIRALEQAIADSKAKTLGSFLFLERRAKNSSTRMRGDLGWYPLRRLYTQEFAEIKKAQEAYFPNILPEDWQRLDHILYYQRPLKKPIIGRCLFEPQFSRAPRALPSFQRFRMLQQLANLKIKQPGLPAESLTEEERSLLISKLNVSKTLTFDSARKLLKKPDCRFNLEEDRNSFRAAKHFHGLESSTLLMKPEFFGASWKNLSEKEQDEVVELILNEEEEGELCKKLSQRFSLEKEQLDNIAAVSADKLEKEYAQFSKVVLQKLNAALLENPSFTYDQAAEACGYHHSDFRPDELKSRLPYYGEVLKRSVVDAPNSKVAEERQFGKISNPTVHVALNQLRKIINALLERYGHIDEMVVEVARDLPLGEKGIKELAREQKANEEQNDKWASKLEELNKRNTYNNRLRLRLWEELNEHPTERKCPYSGEMINIEKLFSNEVEADHILPKSRTFSNHHSNLVLCTKRANQLKGDRSPYEAFGAENSPYEYSEILQRIASLPWQKEQKFYAEAMDEFAEEDKYLERQLNDTRFIAKSTCEYLAQACKRVMVSRGRLTAYLRSEVDLNRLLSGDNKKNRNDHRHHAIDAFLLGLSAPRTLKGVTRALQPNYDGREKESLSNLVEDLRSHINEMIVSHRVDHSPATRFFEDTAYGKAAGSHGILKIRKAVSQITDPSTVVDPRISEFLRINSNLSKEELANLVFEKFSCKKLQTIKKDVSAILVNHPKLMPRFKKWLIPSDNYALEFWQVPGRERSNELTVISYNSQEAASGAYLDKKPHPAARKVLVIRKGDTLRIQAQDGRERTVVVESLKPVAQQIMFTEHNIGKSDNAVGRTITFGKFATNKLRVVHVNVLGEVKDPGPWWINDSKNSRNTESRVLFKSPPGTLGRQP